MRTRTVSMADVAAQAGVSSQTVSRVANGSPRVDPATRARVEKAMNDLGYRVHRAARALRTGQTQTLGVVVATLETVGNSLMLEAVMSAASRRGYAIALVPLGEDTVSAALARLHHQGVDGVVVLNEASALTPTAELPAGLRLVVVDGPTDERYVAIGVDHFGGARAAVDHLLAQGHRRIAHVGGPRGSFAAAERARAWAEALGDTGCATDLREEGDWTAESGYAATQRLLERASPTALFAANDQMALGAMRAATERGYGVPSGMSVVGFDDVADAANYRPPLTTVRQNFTDLGEVAVASLVEESASGETHQSVACELIVRASTAFVREA